MRSFATVISVIGIALFSGASAEATQIDQNPRQELSEEASINIFAALQAFSAHKRGSVNTYPCRLIMDPADGSIKIIDHLSGRPNATAGHGRQYHQAFGLTKVFIGTVAEQKQITFWSSKLTLDTDFENRVETTNSVFVLTPDETAIQSVSIDKKEEKTVLTPTGKITDFKSTDWVQKSSRKITTLRQLQKGRCDFNN